MNTQRKYVRSLLQIAGLLIAWLSLSVACDPVELPQIGPSPMITFTDSLGETLLGLEGEASSSTSFTPHITAANGFQSLRYGIVSGQDSTFLEEILSEGTNDTLVSLLLSYTFQDSLAGLAAFLSFETTDQENQTTHTTLPVTTLIRELGAAPRIGIGDVEGEPISEISIKEQDTLSLTLTVEAVEGLASFLISEEIDGDSSQIYSYPDGSTEQDTLIVIHYQYVVPRVDEEQQIALRFFASDVEGQQDEASLTIHIKPLVPPTIVLQNAEGNPLTEIEGEALDWDTVYVEISSPEGYSRTDYWQITANDSSLIAYEWATGGGAVGIATALFYNFDPALVDHPAELHAWVTDKKGQIASASLDIITKERVPQVPVGSVTQNGSIVTEIEGNAGTTTNFTLSVTAREGYTAMEYGLLVEEAYTPINSFTRTDEAPVRSKNFELSYTFVDSLVDVDAQLRFIITDDVGQTTVELLDVVTNTPPRPVASFPSITLFAPSPFGDSKSFINVATGDTYEPNEISATPENSSLIDFGYVFTFSNNWSFASPLYWRNVVAINDVFVDISGWPVLNSTTFRSTSLSQAEFVAIGDNDGLALKSNYESGIDTPDQGLINDTEVGQVIAFQTAKGKHGLLHIIEINGTFQVDDNIVFALKVEE
ncbi:MAG TPA: hypothetical protein DCR93_33220 [Cytophagales bacterium]|nr:hypothetical protein [Cytophagales bacterium]